jgi:hypothetical protein
MMEEKIKIFLKCLINYFQCQKILFTTEIYGRILFTFAIKNWKNSWRMKISPNFDLSLQYWLIGSVS